MKVVLPFAVLLYASFLRFYVPPVQGYFADIRINRYRNESISTRERQVQNVSHTQSFGFGVRVLLKGTWGFAASGVVSPEEVRRVTREAIEIALRMETDKETKKHLENAVGYMDHVECLKDSSKCR